MAFQISEELLLSMCMCMLQTGYDRWDRLSLSTNTVLVLGSRSRDAADCTWQPQTGLPLPLGAGGNSIS